MKVAEHSPGITLGRHLHKPGGAFEPIEGDGLGAALALVLQEHRGPGAWWAPGIFEDDVRQGDRWRGAWTLGVDGDYYAKGLGHAPPPDHARALLVPALARVLAGALYHDTPRGFRNVLVLDRCITDKDEYTKLATAIQRRVERGLAGAGILGEVRRVGGGDVVVERDGFIVDTGALFDRARLYFAPNAVVEGEPAPRRAEIVTLGGGS